MSTHTTHTPGPWRAGQSALLNWAIADVNNRVIARMSACEHEEANARLIAQAPAMLEALRSICQQEAQFWHDTGLAKNKNEFEMDGLAEAVNKARALLAQIEKGE